MEEEIVQIINIKTDQAITTVKELKQYISELRDDLVKVDKNSEEYNKTLEEIAKAQTKLTNVTRDAKNAINYNTGSYRELNQELVNLRNDYKNLTEEQRNNSDVGGKMLSRIQELDKELKSIDATMGNYQRNVGHYQLALEALNKTYSNQREELSALKKAMDNLDPSTKEYEQAFNRASEITHNLADRQEMLRYSSADLGDQLSNIRGIATNMIAGFSAVNAAMGLFGQKSEDVQEAMLKVQQAMAVVQGLQGLDGFIKRTQGLSTAIKVWIADSKAAAAATKAQTAATNGQTVATNTATVAQKGLNAAMKANPVGAIIIGITALIAAIKPLIKLFDRLSGKTQQMVEDAKASEQAFKDFNTVISNLDRENRLEIIQMEVAGIANSVIVLKKVDQAQEKLNKTEAQFNSELFSIVETLSNYNSDAKITTGTLKDMGFSQDQINDLMETGKINIEENDKVLKKLKKNDALKVQFENAVKYRDAIKDINKTISELEIEGEESRLREEANRRKEAENAAKEAARRREQIERDYTSKIQNIYGSTARGVVESYRDALNTFKDEMKLQLKVEKDPDSIKNIKSVIDQINNKLAGLNDVNVFKQEDIEESLNLLTKTYKSRLSDAIKNSAEDNKKKIHDEIVKLFERTIKPDINKELADIQFETDKQTLLLDYNIDYGDYSKRQETELEKVAVKYDGLNKQLEAQLDHYNQIVEFVETNNLTPSNEYEIAKQKLAELNLEQEKMADLRRKDTAAVQTKYFNQTLAQIQGETDATIQAIEGGFSKAQSEIGTKWYDMFMPIDPQEEQKYLDDIFNTQMTGLNKMKNLWAERAKDENLTNEQRVEARKNLADVEIQIADAELQHEIEINNQKKELTNEWVSQMSNAVSTIGDLFGSLASYYQDDIEYKRKHNQITDKEAEKEFEKKVKPLQIAQATVSMLQGMVSAYASAMQLGPIAGPIVGGALAAAVGTMGALNIAKIKNTKYNGGDSSNSSASVPAPQINDIPVQYVSNITNQTDTDNLRNAIVEGMSATNLYVSVTDINTVQNRVKVTENESSF